MEMCPDDLVTREGLRRRSQRSDEWVGVLVSWGHPQCAENRCRLVGRSLSLPAQASFCPKTNRSRRRRSRSRFAAFCEKASVRLPGRSAQKIARSQVSWGHSQCTENGRRPVRTEPLPTALRRAPFDALSLAQDKCRLLRAGLKRSFKFADRGPLLWRRPPILVG
jgi:hypothetical protein